MDSTNSPSQRLAGVGAQGTSGCHVRSATVVVTYPEQVPDPCGVRFLDAAGTEPFHITGLGVRLTVAVEDASLHSLVRTVLTDLMGAAVDSPQGHIRVVGHGPWRVRSPSSDAVVTSRDETLSALSAAVNQTVIDLVDGLALHAAVLCRDGATVVLAAPSRTGKTTLTAALLDGGWGYVTDECLLVPWSGQAVPAPYHRALALSKWSLDALGWSGTASVAGVEEQMVVASSRNGRLSDFPEPVSDVVLLRREGRTPGMFLTHRTAALRGLLARGFNHHERPADALEVLTRLTQNARTWRLDSSAPRDTAALLTKALSRPR